MVHAKPILLLFNMVLRPSLGILKLNDIFPIQITPAYKLVQSVILGQVLHFFTCVCSFSPHGEITSTQVFKRITNTKIFRLSYCLVGKTEQNKTKQKKNKKSDPLYGYQEDVLRIIIRRLYPDSQSEQVDLRGGCKHLSGYMRAAMSVHRRGGLGHQTGQGACGSLTFCQDRMGATVFSFLGQIFNQFILQIFENYRILQNQENFLQSHIKWFLLVQYQFIIKILFDADATALSHQD